MAPVPALKVIEHLPEEYKWLCDHLDMIEVRREVGHKTEISGIILVNPDQKPDTAKAALVYMLTRFLNLVDECGKNELRLDRLPEIVIGQVGSGYRAQVTLTLKNSTYVSPYTGGYKTGYKKTLGGWVSGSEALPKFS